MSRQFVSEPITPVAATMDARRMARGEPGLPGRFLWRDQEYEVAEVLEQWRETGPCKSGSDEQYVRKHWYRIRTTSGEEMKLYFERQARSGRERTLRWWLHSLSTEE
jgi:phosphoribosylglycinamide formyltransferase-1